MSVRAEPTDIDELGHVSNLIYLKWVQDVAKAHSAAVGWNHARYAEEGGVFVVRRHTLEYLAQTFLSEVVELSTWIEKWSPVTCERHTRMVRAGDQRLVLTAVTTWVFVTTRGGRPCRVPEALSRLFGATAQ